MSYFDELFGTPEMQRREHWDGKEEPVAGTWKIITKAGTGQQWPFWSGPLPVPPLTPEVYQELGLEPPIIDADYEIVE